jgi:hypothetical protein
MRRCPVGLRIILLASLSTVDVRAGEIAGMPTQAPPFLERDFEINLSNDFLGRGGSVDDFRTQQIIVTARLGDDWLALVDHSILTVGSGTEQGRLDQLSASLGYQLIAEHETGRVNRLTVGAGLRGSGDYSGARMQNGFHRLVGSDVETMPYVDTKRTDATLWVDAEIYRSFHESRERGLFGGWRSGYWLRGGALVTSDGQSDGMLGAYAITSRNSIDLWLGVRRDWRQGYDRDFVQSVTAAAESDLGVVVGARFGAFLLETVQQPNGDASYGQLKFVSAGQKPFPAAAGWPKAALDVGFLLPNVHVQLAARYRSNFFIDDDSSWRQSVLLETRYGEPQFEDNTSVFVRSLQVAAGLEMERVLSIDLPWMSLYGSLSAGYRSEQLLGDNVLAGQRSSTIGRAVFGAGTGLRFNAAALGAAWSYRLQLGLTAWFPTSDSEVALAGGSYRIQKPALAILLGMTFEYR